MNIRVNVAEVVAALREAGACFAVAHGSRASDVSTHPGSDFDVGAWWNLSSAPQSWEVQVPDYVDLVVLNTAPLWLAGRVAQYGHLLYDDDPAARVRWQAETRLQYLDELPALRQRYRARRLDLAAGLRHG